MRGKVSDAMLTGQPTRITPAHAGKSVRLCGCPPPHKDHPRPCGEKLAKSRMCLSVTGSPPPMRGKVHVTSLAGYTVGITPAHAGKSVNSLYINRRVKDHPRPCGEKHIYVHKFFSFPGSPPPMRGKDRHKQVRDARGRITPAHAGKRCAYSRHFVPHEDHPRPCGEKLGNTSKATHGAGSPPPMRGKATARAWARLSWRITPAHAGKSRQRNSTWSCAQDHPRPCGEKCTPMRMSAAA